MRRRKPPGRYCCLWRPHCVSPWATHISLSPSRPSTATTEIAAFVANRQQAQAIVPHRFERSPRHISLGVAGPDDAELAKLPRDRLGARQIVTECVVVEEELLDLRKRLKGPEGTASALSGGLSILRGIGSQLGRRHNRPVTLDDEMPPSPANAAWPERAQINRERDDVPSKCETVVWSWQPEFPREAIFQESLDANATNTAASPQPSKHRRAAPISDRGKA